MTCNSRKPCHVLSPFARMHSIEPLIVPIVHLTLLTWDWTRRILADVFVENILCLGDTRSADDLSVFTKMAPERLCLGCRLRVDEPFANCNGIKEKTLLRCSEAPHFCPARSECTDTQ